MSMQHLKPIFLAVWVAGCVFHVAGFPTEGQTTRWFGTIRKTPSVVLSGTGVVAKGVVYGASEVAKGVVDYGALIGEVTSGVADGANSVMEKVADYGAEEALLNGIVNGANAVAKGYVDYGVNEAINTGLAYGAIACGASAAVKYGVDEVTKRVVNYLVREAMKSGAKAFTVGLANGAMSAANMILSSAKFFSGGAQDAANMVTGGILHGATVVSGGVQNLANALSGVSFEKLTSSLNLPKDFSNFNMFDMLANFIISQSFRNEGGKTSINFETATLFLEKLAVDVPALKQPGKALKIVSFVLPQIHPEEQHAADVMSKAVNMYFRDVDEDLKKKLITEVAPKMPAAAKGHKNAALEIIRVFIDRNHLKEVLGAAAVKGIGGPLQHVLNTAKFVSGVATGLAAHMLVKSKKAPSLQH